jgi:diacylglycerol kinase (ATP)
VQAVAIFGPRAREGDLRPFREAGAPIDVAKRVGDAEVALIFGGDGTVHRYLSDAVAAQTKVLVVPVGSGNDFAAALGLKSPADSLRGWKQFLRDRNNVRSIDLGRIEPLNGGAVRYFCCIGGTGLDAETNRRANAQPAWMRARGGYVLAALRAIAAYSYPEITVSAEEPPLSLEGRATLVAFANAPAYGGGMRMAPNARMDDGKLDLVYARHISKPRLFRFFPRVFQGTHIALEEVEYFQSKCLRVETQPAMAVYADGEYVCETPVEVRVVPQALTVIV